jgi:membrane protease subunit HflK
MPELKTTETPPQSDRPLDSGSQALSEALRSSFALVKFVMVILVLVFLGSGIFQVKQGTTAILLRFGKPVGTGEAALLKPGLHFSLPYPIDDHVAVSISGIQKVRSTAGWYAVTDAQRAAGIEPMAGATLNPAADGYALTADQNIVHAEATLSYRISDPVVYVFNFTSAQLAVQQTLDDALLFTAAHFKVDDILRGNRLGFKDAVLRKMTELARERELGIEVGDCTVLSVPPRQLKDAFNEVLKAELNRNIALNDARAYANTVTNKAGADAQGRINLAETEKVQLVNEIAGKAKQFTELLPKYRENPQLFAQQRLTETVGRVLTNVQDKIMVPESADGQMLELRYLFNREFPKVNVESGQPK